MSLSRAVNIYAREHKLYCFNITKAWFTLAT